MPPAFAGRVGAQPHLLLLIIQVADHCAWLRSGERARKLDGRFRREMNVAVAVAIRERM